MTIRFDTNADGSLVCAHRDLSVCPTCAKAPGVHDVYGAHFHFTDVEWRAFQRLLG
jgi:hypothetical protein